LATKRVDISEELVTLLACAEQLVQDLQAQAVVVLADIPYDFIAMKQLLNQARLVVASDEPEVHRIAAEDGIDLVTLVHDPEARRLQLSQALLEAIADELLSTGDRVIALYPGFESHAIDTISVINLTENLSRLTSRDLQRLETHVPLETLRSVVDLAVEIGREGREGKPVGTLFVVGNHRKVLAMSHEQIHDPFRGYSRKERQIRDPRVRESIKEIAQIDGAFVISADGIVQAAGRHLNAPGSGVQVSRGLGSRHWAAAAMSKATAAIGIAVSESTGTVRIFQDGRVVLRIEPMDRAMKWTNVSDDDSTGSD
jgi:DNA integrity scanning protein DisA with diadenylate cyclase activity